MFHPALKRQKNSFFGEFLGVLEEFSGDFGRYLGGWTIVLGVKE